MENVRVAIIGGGVSGLTAAFRLRAGGLSSVVFEESDRLGGRVKTARKNGFAFDVGAVGLLGSFKETASLAAALGIGDLLDHGPARIGITRDGVLHVLDTARPWDTLKTHLLSTRDKLSLLRLVPALIASRGKMDFENFGQARDIDREDVESLCRRLLTPDAAAFLIGPMLRALWQSDAGPMPAIDLFWALKHFTPSMYALDGGMDVLPQALAEQADVRTGSRVLSVRSSGRDVEIVYEREGREHVEIFDRCIVALPPAGARKIVKGLSPEMDDAFGKLDYSCSVNVHFAMSRPVGGDLHMMMPPDSEFPDLTTVAFEDRKGRGRVPEGRGGVSLFLHDRWSRARLDAGDNSVIADGIAIAARAIPDFAERDIEFAHVERWKTATGLRKVGTSAAIATLFEGRRSIPGIFFAGDYFAPSSVNTAVVSGTRAADELMSSVSAG